jgi:hypothetical protein
MSARDRNRMKASAYQAAAGSLAGELIGQKDIIRNMKKMPGDVQAKITQNAIKPIVKLSTATWKRQIKSAKVSGNSNAFRRRYGGTSLRVALAKSVKSRNPSGKGKKSLRGYSMSAGGVTKHGAKGEATTNAGQIWWLEYGTKPHSLGKGRRHPGTKPVTHIRKAVDRLKPRALRMFETAVRLGMRSGGERITAQQFKRMTK